MWEAYDQRGISQTDDDDISIETKNYNERSR